MLAHMLHVPLDILVHSGVKKGYGCTRCEVETKASAVSAPYVTVSTLFID